MNGFQRHPSAFLLVTCVTVCGAISQHALASGSSQVGMEETLVTATTSERLAFELPYTVNRIDRQEMLRESYRTLPQLLRDTPGIMVQETAVGQGSPYIRGLTGYHTLLMIDGVRINNSVFRAGPNQYWATVDASGIGGVEVVSGPASALYGSDAIGGTVNVLSYQALSDETRLNYRYASAEDSHIGRIYHSSGNERYRAGIGLTGKDFGDFTAGDDEKQPGTGYDEYDLDLKLNAMLDEQQELIFLLQHVRQNNVPRTHRTNQAVSWQGTSVGSDIKRELDQERQLAYLKYKGRDLNTLLLDGMELTLSFQHQEEGRDRIKSSGSRSWEGFEVDTWGLDGQFYRQSGIGHLSWGFDAYADRVDSFSSGNPIQGPVGDDASYDTLGIYLQDEIHATEQLRFILGARYSMVDLEAGSVQDPLTGLQTSLRDDWNKFTANARALYAISDTINVFTGISQGFRAPNLSDLTRLDSARSNEFEIPAPGLSPEDFLSYELGIKINAEDYALQAAIFRSDIDNMIVRVPTGNIVDGDAEITKRNAGDGYVQGLDLHGQLQVNQDLSLSANVSWQDGELDTYPTSAPVLKRETIDRLMPLTLQFRARQDACLSPSLWCEAAYTHAEEQDELSTRDAADTSRIPPGGTPGYDRVDLALGWQVTSDISVITRIDNLTDEDYRIHGSGTNMPGRSFIASIDIKL